MSRIGNNPISIPEEVEVHHDGNKIIAKGKMGEMTQEIDTKDLDLKIDNNMIIISRKSNEKDIRSKHGLYRSLIANIIEGVSKGFTKKLELRGVGYRAVAQGNQLDISVGYSHNIIFSITNDVKVTAETEKGQPPIVTITGCDKQLVGAIAARIRSERKPEPYKGKGIRYVNEYVRKKAGKTATS